MPDNSQANISTSASVAPPASAPASGDSAVSSVASSVAQDSTMDTPQPILSPIPNVSGDSGNVQPAELSPEQNAIANSNAIMQEVAGKIADARNILVALSNDPTVDDLAGAIGLSLYLDKLGKRATAIYSGATPNALEFLKPEENFDANADTLQDFVIALNKDKADHLRYKLDGDYVKIFITPYRTRIAEEDLEFSYGDYNVDLVLALDVANGTDLDSALREHGRIMHDATIINITNGNPGKFGELEWSNLHASSVCEMLADLLIAISGKTPIDAESATALLTGIVSATERFSEANTTPDTMKVASKLMEAGADQQLVSQNIINAEEQAFAISNSTKSESNDPTSLEIEHEETESKGSDTSDKGESAREVKEEPKEELRPSVTEETDDEKPVEEVKESVSVESAESVEKPSEASEPKDESASETVGESETLVKDDNPDLLSDLKAAEASLTSAGAETTPETVQTPLRIDDSEPATPAPVTGIDSLSTVGPFGLDTPSPMDATASGIISAPNLSGAPDLPSVSSAPLATDTTPFSEKPEKIITPPEDFASNPTGAEQNKYGKMLEDALAEVGDASASTVPESVSNPATSVAPSVASEPEINGVPAINYMPLPEDQVLPPPPAPPVDFDAPMPDTADSAPTMVASSAPEITPAVSPAENNIASAQPDASVTNPAPDPSAFRIPGIQ